MASRLSEDTLKAAYDAGHQALAVQNENSLDLLSTHAVDLEPLLYAEDPEAAIQALHPQPLYHALLRRGLEDSLDVLQLISREQLVRIFDYDVWNEDRIAPLQAFKWLRLFKEISHEELYKRYRELDEEYQVALLAPFVQLVDEDAFEKLKDFEQDALNRLPCGTLYYKINSDDPKVEEFVADLLEAALDSDIAYAYSLLAHAAYMPPNEQEVSIAQFRRARLEEDGFVTYEESLSVFRPLDLDLLRRKWQPTREGGNDLAKSQSDGDKTPFVVRVVQAGIRNGSQEQASAMLQGFAFLANTLCAAAKVDPDDLSGQKRVLQQAQALSSLALEYFSRGDVELGVRILMTEHPRVLFRAGLSLVATFQEAMLARLEDVRIPKATEIRRLWTLDKRGAMLVMLETSTFDTLGFERAEMLKGLFNRFPVRQVATAPDSDGSPRTLYKPIATLADLRELAESLDGLAGMLHLAQLTTEGEASLVDLDRQLTTALAQVLAGGAFRYRPLSDAETKALVEMPQAAARSMTSDLFNGVEGSLRVALMNDAAASSSLSAWSISRALDISAGDPVQPVMAEFSDLVMRLTLAREGVRTDDVQGAQRALRAVVDFESTVYPTDPAATETM